MSLATSLPSYLQIYHCAGKLAGVEIGLYQLDDAPDAFAVVALRPDTGLSRLPVMSEAAANAAYWELVRECNANSV